MSEKTLHEILIDDLLGNSSKSPRENAAVAEILQLRARVAELEKHGKAGKGGAAHEAEKSD